MGPEKSERAVYVLSQSLSITLKSHLGCFDKALQPFRPAGMTQFTQRLGLDLANPFTGDREILADLLQRMIGFFTDPETHPEDLLFAWSQG